MPASYTFAGERQLGRVHEAAGDYAHTDFATLCYVLPFTALGSQWVEGETSFSIDMQWRSVVSAYLRWYAAPLALAVLFFLRRHLEIAIPLAAILVALTAYTLRWRRVRDPVALRRAELNRLAFGTRCEPAVMFPEMRAALATELRTRWLALTPPPIGTELDTARTGTDNFDEYILAYGLLALTAAGPNGEAEHAGAGRLLQTAPADLSHVAAPAFPDQARSAALSGTLNAYASDRTVNRYFYAIAAALVSAVGLVMEAPKCGEPTPMHVADLTDDTSGLVLITCESQLRTAHSILCLENGATIAVRAFSSEPELPQPVMGEVREPKPNRDEWFYDLQHNAKVLPVFLVRDTPDDARFLTEVSAGCGLLAILFALWARRTYVRERHLPPRRRGWRRARVGRV